MTSLELKQKPNFITDTNYFNTLSNEIINNILHFLVPYEIVKLSQTNQKFRYFITDKENLLSLYKKFKKIDSFWKLFPPIETHIETPIASPIVETPITTHAFDLKTFMILSRFQNGIKRFIKAKTELKQVAIQKCMQIGFSINEITTLFNTFCDKQFINAVKLKCNGIDYRIFYENSYLTDLQVKLAIKLKKEYLDIDDYNTIFDIPNLTPEKVELVIKLNKLNLYFTNFVIHCPDVFTDANISNIIKFTKDFNQGCVMNLIKPNILETEEEKDNIIKFKNNLVLDYDEDNLTTYILAYYSINLTSEQIANAIKYQYINNILQYVQILTQQQWINYDKLPGTLCEELSLYITEYFTDSQVDSIIRLINNTININHNWCIFYVENLNQEQIENVIRLFKQNKYIENIADIYMKYRFVYEIVKCYTTEQISYFTKMG
jgi:hypothetical protein